MSIEYPYLPKGKTISYVPGANPFMREAKDLCVKHSTDDKQPTAAVIVKDGKVLGRGANQSKLRSAFLKKLHEKGWCVRKILKVKTGEKYWMCPGCSGYDMHAEAEAIANTRKNGYATEGADLYLWGHWWCCEPCWKKIIDSGIKNVYLLEKSEVYFNRGNPNNLIGRRNFSKFA